MSSPLSLFCNRDMTLTTNPTMCDVTDAAAVTKETDLDQSIYASIDDLRKDSEECCVGNQSEAAMMSRRTRALSNQYFETTSPIVLCDEKAADCRSTRPPLLAVGEEMAVNAPLPPPRIALPSQSAVTTSEQLQQLRISVSSPGLSSEALGTSASNEPRSSTPISMVYIDPSTQTSQRASRSLPTGLCTVTAGPSLKLDSSEDVYIQMIGESMA